MLLTITSISLLGPAGRHSEQLGDDDQLHEGGRVCACQRRLPAHGHWKRSVAYRSYYGGHPRTIRYVKGGWVFCCVTCTCASIPLRLLGFHNLYPQTADGLSMKAVGVIFLIRQYGGAWVAQQHSIFGDARRIPAWNMLLPRADVSQHTEPFYFMSGERQGIVEEWEIQRKCWSDVSRIPS